MSANETAAKPKNFIIVLDENSDATVTVSPQDKDKFCLSVKDAVQGCRLIGDLMLYCFQVADLQNFVAEWVNARRDHIHSAYITFRPNGHLLLLIVQNMIGKDLLLAEELTDLDIAIANDSRFDQLSLEVMSVPKTSRQTLTAFLTSGEVLVHAQSGSAHTGSH